MYLADSYKLEISTGFPKKFALEIFKRFLIGIILGILFFLYLNLEGLLLAAQDLIPDIEALNLEGLISDSETPRIAPILILFAVVGVVFSIIYNYMHLDLYHSYRVRNPKNLFLTLVIIISVLLIIMLAGIAATCLVKHFGEKILTPAVVAAGISSFFLFSFIVDLIFALVKHKKYTCKNCNLTNALKTQNEILSISEKEDGYWDHGGYSTKHYKVNGEDVSVTYETAPEYHKTYERTSDIRETCYCRICGKTAYTRSYILKS